MSFQSSAETEVFIGTKAPGFLTDVYVKIAGLAHIGPIGHEYDTRRLEPMNSSLARHIKIAGRNLTRGGSVDLTFLFEATDAGQTALIAALNDEGAGMVDSAAYNFRIQLNDKPATGVNPSPTTIHFRAVVTSGILNIGGPTDLAKRIFELQLDSEITITPATSG